MTVRGVRRSGRVDPAPARSLYLDGRPTHWLRASKAYGPLTVTVWWPTSDARPKVGWWT